MWVFQLSTKYVIRTTGQMLLGHHPYGLSGTCQLSKPQKQNAGDNAMEYNTAFTNNNKPRITLDLKKCVGSNC